MLWLGSGRTLLRVSSASVLRVVNPPLEALTLEPLLYLVYTYPMGKIIKRHDIQFSQIYSRVKTDSNVDLQMTKSKQV